MAFRSSSKRPGFTLLAVACAGSVLGLAACGGGNTTTTGGTGNAGNGGSTTTSTGPGVGCPANLAAAPGSDFCAKSAPAVDCSVVSQSDHTQVCGVGIPSPTAELKRSANVMEFAGSGPPDLSCYEPANYPKQGTSMMVQVSGLAKIFAHGCQSSNLTIQVYTVKSTNDAQNGMIDQMVGTAVTTPADCTTTGVAVADQTCGMIYECKYTYDNVPTETPLVFLTKGSMWSPLYEYNDYIPNAAVKNGVWTHDVRALATDDYSAIAQAAIGTSITPGNGAVAGEVHDCGDVRLIGATVDVNVERKLLTYFTTNEMNPLPDITAASTTALGLYAALDIKPGPVTVGALGMVGGKITTVGWFQAHVYPDSVTAVNFKGPNPSQIK